MKRQVGEMNREKEKPNKQFSVKLSRLTCTKKKLPGEKLTKCFSTFANVSNAEVLVKYLERK